MFILKVLLNDPNVTILADIFWGAGDWVGL